MVMSRVTRMLKTLKKSTGNDLPVDMRNLEQLRRELATARTREEARQAWERFEKSEAYQAFSVQGRAHAKRIARRFIFRLGGGG